MRTKEQEHHLIFPCCRLSHGTVVAPSSVKLWDSKVTALKS